MLQQTTNLDALDRMRAAHITAMNTGDAEMFVRCFHPDGIQMPPNQPVNIGIEHIRAWIAGFMGAFETEFTLDPQDVEFAGHDVAIERGAYEIRIGPRASGESQREAGKYITTWGRAADGSWLMTRDIWSSDGPPPV